MHNLETKPINLNKIRFCKPEQITMKNRRLQGLIQGTRNIFQDIADAALQNAAQIIDGCGSNGLVFAQLVNGRTGDVVVFNQRVGGLFGCF